MTSESRYLVPYLLLEAGQDGNGDEHDGQSEGDGSNGDPDNRPGEVGLAPGQGSPGDEKFGVQATVNVPQK
jgi:hypothetical protein